MKIYETPTINVEKFYAENIITTSSQAAENVNAQVRAAIPTGNEVKAVDTLRWVL